MADEVVTLREYVTALFREAESRTDQQFKSVYESIAQLRASVKELEGASMPRSEADQRFKLGIDAVSTALAAAEKAVQTAMSAAEKAVLKAETAADKRFEGVNEMRAMVNDAMTRLMPRAETDQRLSALDEKISTLAKRVDTHEGSGAGSRMMWGYIVAVIGMVIAVAAIFFGEGQVVK